MKFNNVCEVQQCGKLAIHPSRAGGLQGVALELADCHVVSLDV
jgi:hypothetical protein